MFVPIVLACIVAVFGKPHHGVISHGHHHHHESSAQQTDAIAPFIVGGSNAVITDWPWQSSLLTKTNFMFCGGSLIQPHTNGNYYVLTAAHCVDGTKATNLKVNFAQYRYSHAEDTTKQTVLVSGIQMHESYNSNTLRNDIALLTLTNQPNVSSPAIGPVNLPATDSQLSDGSMVWATGFGTISSGGSVPGFLQEVEKPYVNDADCQKAYGNEFYGDTMLCAGTTGKDACQGDSGGPLVYSATGKGGDFTLYGVVSWGIGCGLAGYPGVYAEVSHYIDWINDNTQ